MVFSLSLSFDASPAVLSQMQPARTGLTCGAVDRRDFIPVACFLSRARRARLVAQVQLEDRLSRRNLHVLILTDAPAVLRLEVDHFGALAQVDLLDEAARTASHLRKHTRAGRRPALRSEHCPTKGAKAPQPCQSASERLIFRQRL